MRLSQHISNSVLLGTYLGDMGIYKRSDCVNAYMHMQHSTKQKDYFYWKVNIISHKYGEPKITEGKVNNKYPFVRAYWPTSKNVTRFYNRFCNNGRKVIGDKILNCLNPVALAVWYMDDGSVSVKLNKNTGNIKAKVGSIATHCYDKDDIDKFIAWLNRKHGIEARRHRDKKYWRTQFNTKNINKLIDVIKDVVKEVPSMCYKIR